MLPEPLRGRDERREVRERLPAFRGSIERPDGSVVTQQSQDVSQFLQRLPGGDADQPGSLLQRLRLPAGGQLQCAGVHGNKRELVGE